MNFDRLVSQLEAGAGLSPEEARDIGERFLNSVELTERRNLGPSGDPCPHGDLACPCQDYNDPCHYEGPDAMDCPHPTSTACDLCDQGKKGGHNYHCHAEGCEASGHGCALQHLGLPSPTAHKRPVGSYLDALRGTPSWYCGVRRAIAAELDSRS